MKKWHRFALWCGAAAALLLAGGMLMLHMLTDGERLKQSARDYARKTWSRELAMDELALTFKPTPRLHATNVSLSNPAWSQEKTMVQAKDISARLELWPLLRGRVVIHSVDVDGFQINLEQAADGRKSWDLAAASTAPGDRARTQPLLAGVVLESLSLRNGMLNFRDGAGEASAWQVSSAGFESSPGWRNVMLDVQAARGGHAFALQGKLDDISRLGTRNAVSNGQLRLQAGTASVTATGALPIDTGLHTYKLNLVADAPSLDAIFAVLGIKQKSPAPLNAALDLQAVDDVIDASTIKLQLGKMTVTGEIRGSRRAGVPVIAARLHADHIDWLQTRADSGLPPLPPKPAGELFHDNPLPWDLLAATDGVEGTLRMTVQWLKLRSGVEMTDIASDMKFARGQLTVDSFNAKLLGGTAQANAMLNGAKRSVRLDLRLKDTLLGTWAAQTHKKVALVGGRMQVHANVNMSGKSMKALAASVTGPVTVDVGTATVDSKKISEAETLMVGLTPFFSAKGSDRFELSCVGATLPFKAGVASGDKLIGIRSDASQLLTRGSVDLRQQTLDLHGPVNARAGIAIGVASFANELKIVGKIAAPKTSLDEAGAPGAIARIAAAILTGGASIIGTTLWDGAQAAPNPCLVALARSGKDAPGRAKAVGRRPKNN